MLVRSWNLHLGKTGPDGKGGHVRERVELAVSGDPAIVCLQEVPASALGKLQQWSGIQAVTARTQRSRLGPLAVPGAMGSQGKGNAILFMKDATLRQEKQITLNTNPF